jgi:transcriptional regulator with XRE-family HTH domain
MVPAGQKLYLLRIQKGMTQTALSERSGIPQANLSKIEQGKQDPTVSTLLRICSALEIRPAELFEEKTPTRRLVLTRAVAERITRAVWDPGIKLSPQEKGVKDLLSNLVPEAAQRRLSDKQAYQAWLAFREAFRPEEIKFLTERVREKKLH